MDIAYEGDCGELYIFTDICGSSYVNGSFRPMIRVVERPESSFNTPYFIPIARNFIDHINLYIRTRHGDIPSFIPKRLKYTLHLRPKNVSH